ncbi:MAG: hypothetical protein Q8P67_20915 [archaeon]|nr:hypothetical protein [archaeon]
MSSTSAAAVNEGSYRIDDLVKLIERREKEIADGVLPTMSHQHMEETEVALLDGTVVFGKQDRQVAETGGAVWDGALVLAEFFAANIDLLFHSGRKGKRSHIDLGSGTGFLGAALACLQTRHEEKEEKEKEEKRIHVVVSDNAPNVELMHATLVRNKVAECGLSVAYPWGEEIGEASPLKPLLPFDIILGSDLVYNPDSMPELFRSLDMLSGPHTQIFLSWNEHFRYVDDGFLELHSGSTFSLEYVFGPAPTAPIPPGGPRISPMRIVKLTRSA